MSETGNEILWHVSTLSAIAGPIEAVFEDGAGVAWATEVGGDWWLRLFKKDEEFLIHMDDRYGDRLKMMTVAGYAQHCAEDMEYTICNWDEFVGDMEARVAH
jgi:hypothetical protein|tara:strand:+ start:900 stop:1205 length:306 start_codon:yes stop_codon:yes gene_type:complete